MDERRRGVILGTVAYLLWGIFPLYWPLLRPAGAIEILAHRVVWSLVFVAALLARAGGLGRLRSIGRRRGALLGAASAFIALNWGLYIWAVNAHHVVETALGYFMNPLVTVTLGVVALGERLRRMQWAAIGLAAVAVVVLAVDYGRLPYVALTLATSFALYGLLKKRAAVGAVESLAVETMYLFLPALVLLVRQEVRGAATFGHAGAVTSLLLVSSGVVTAVPLLCFAGAANRVPLTTLGLLQYIAPILQFGCGVLVFHEDMPPSRWIGFGLVWSALALFVGEGVAHRRRREVVAPA